MKNMNFKKPLLSLALLGSGIILGLAFYTNAQELPLTSVVTQLFGRDALVESERVFQYQDDTSLNPDGHALESGPITGKITTDILTAKEFNRLLELASNSGSGIGGVSCGSGEVMVGIGESGEPSCLKIVTETVDVDTVLNPINGTWTGYFSAGEEKELTPGQYICGVGFRKNCDFRSSEDACINLKICNP